MSVSSGVTRVTKRISFGNRPKAEQRDPRRGADGAFSKLENHSRRPGDRNRYSGKSRV